MKVFISNKFEKDPIKSSRDKKESPFSHFKSVQNILRRSRAANSVVIGPIWPQFELI